MESIGCTNLLLERNPRGNILASMVLAIDIVNTTTASVVSNGKQIVSHFSIATQPGRTADEITLQLKALAKARKLHLSKASQILICSVVPRMTAVLVQALEPLG